jgi:hypothetical protein
MFGRRPWLVVGVVAALLVFPSLIALIVNSGSEQIKGRTTNYVCLTADSLASLTWNIDANCPDCGLTEEGGAAVERLFNYLREQVAAGIDDPLVAQAAQTVASLNRPRQALARYSAARSLSEACASYRSRTGQAQNVNQP